MPSRPRRRRRTRRRQLELEPYLTGDAVARPPGLLPARADGTAKDVAAEWGVDWLSRAAAALLVDLDEVMESYR